VETGGGIDENVDGARLDHDALYHLFHFPERVRWQRIGMIVK
jgi:hypothetical protein